MPDQRLWSRMGRERNDPPAYPDTPEWRPLATSEFERLTRFVQILLEWDDRRPTVDDVPQVTVGANSVDTSVSFEQSRVVRERLDQKPGA